MAGGEGERGRRDGWIGLTPSGWPVARDRSGAIRAVHPTSSAGVAARPQVGARSIREVGTCPPADPAIAEGWWSRQDSNLQPKKAISASSLTNVYG